MSQRLPPRSPKPVSAQPRVDTDAVPEPRPALLAGLLLALAALTGLAYGLWTGPVAQARYAHFAPAGTPAPANAAVPLTVPVPTPAPTSVPGSEPALPPVPPPPAAPGQTSPLPGSSATPGAPGRDPFEVLYAVPSVSPSPPSARTSASPFLSGGPGGPGSSATPGTRSPSARPSTKHRSRRGHSGRLLPRTTGSRHQWGVRPASDTNDG